MDRKMEKHCVALMILKITGCSDDKATEAAQMIDRYYEGFKDAAPASRATAMSAEPVAPMLGVEVKMPKYEYQKDESQACSASFSGYGEYTPITVRGSSATPPSSGNADAVREIATLRGWKSAVLEKCRHSDGYASLKWGGDKNGWGFIHYFIGHLETRALTAEAALSSAPVAGEWKDISTAPKDRDILAVRIDWWTPENGDHRWINGNIRQTKWDAERQRFGFNHERQPTHWTEVPAIPALPISRNDRGEVQS